MVSVCLPSDALSQHLLSYLGFSYLGCGVYLHSCSSKVQPLLDIGNLFLFFMCVSVSRFPTWAYIIFTIRGKLILKKHTIGNNSSWMLKTNSILNLKKIFPNCATITHKWQVLNPLGFKKWMQISSTCVEYGVRKQRPKHTVQQHLKTWSRWLI